MLFIRRLSCMLLMVVVLFGGAAATPSNVEAKELYTWKEQKVGAQRACIEQEKGFARQVNSDLKLDLKLYETDHFLVYTDIPEFNGKRWAADTDGTYRDICKLFEIPDAANLWKGKATIFLFKSRNEFMRFEKRFYGNDITFQAGLCHQHFNGEVRISFYAVKDARFLKQLMIHEMTHGVLHRYQSSKRIDTWLNEGIAEWTASKLLGTEKPFRFKKSLSAKYLRKEKVLPSDFFGEKNFKPEFYGTALALTEKLVKLDKGKFLHFLQDMKKGMSWQNSLMDAYKMSGSDLFGEYAKGIGVSDLQMPRIVMSNTKNVTGENAGPTK